MSKITITNNRPGGFGIPGGPVILGKGTIEVEASDWAKVEDHPVVKAWVDEGNLTIEGKSVAKTDDSPDRDELKKQANELGLQYPGNISNVKLKEMIDAKLAE
ncbi:hypothetical protein [Neorhizobium tomejilense]|uniref:hypothetical protein n=1 Tax=Neorhizobium tomejilense TaxID=2093828 RepID=UPI000CF963C8|nr:hypothetical protein [Neorhizobium tomejilense]